MTDIDVSKKKPSKKWIEHLSARNQGKMSEILPDKFFDNKGLKTICWQYDVFISRKGIQFAK